MKFSSPANIALASIALSSPNLLSSPVFANAAPTGNTGSLSPNLGAGYMGTSPQMHATESPVMPTPPTSKIAGRRRSLRRSRSIRHRKGEKASRNIDPLGLGMSVGATQPGAESILHPRSGSGAVDPFSPIVGSGGLLANTGLVPPNTPMLAGVPLSNGVDPSTLLGAIPGMVPAPGVPVDNVIPIIQNSLTGAPGLLSPLTAGSLPNVNGLLPNIGAVPQIPDLGNLAQAPGGIAPLAGGLPLIPGVSGQVPGVLNTLPQIPGVSQQAGSLSVALPGLAPPAGIPNLGGSLPPAAGSLPQVPGLVQSAGGAVQVPDAVPRIPDVVSQASSTVPQVPGGGAVPKLSGMVPGLPVDPSSNHMPSPVGLPISVGSAIPLASPVTGLVAPTNSLAVPATNMIPTSRIALPTLTALPASVSHLAALPTQPIESLVPASNSVPHILVSSPDEIGAFERLEGIGAGAMGRPEDDGAQTESAHPEKDGPVQVISGIKSSVESGAVAQSARQTSSGPVPTDLPRVDVPATTELLISKPEPTLDTEEILPMRRRELESPSPSDIGSDSPLLPVPTPAMDVTRLSVPTQDTPSVSRSSSMVTLKSFSMASITEGVAPAQTIAPLIGGIRSSMDMAQPTGLVPTISDDSLSGDSSSDERPLLVSPTVASSPISSLYTGGLALSRTLTRSADTPLSTLAINEDSPNVPSPALLGSGTIGGSQDTATRKIFRWGVPKMVTSTIRSVATAVKK